MNLLSLFKNTADINKNTLILGEDDFLNNYLAQSFIDDNISTNTEVVKIDCTADNLDELNASLTESSLFSNRKIILVKNPFFLTSKTFKKNKKQIDKLQLTFDHIQELDDIVILLASYDKIDRRKKITKIIVKNFNVVDTTFKPYELSTIFKALVKLEGYQITTTALQELISRSDQVMDTVLSNYIKLKNIVLDQQITEKVVVQNIDLSLAQNIFAILETAYHKKYQEAIMRLTDQLRQGSSPIQLLTVFSNQIELLLVVKVLATRGRSESQIVKELGVHPYRVKLALQNKMTINRLKAALLQIIKLDYCYKSGIYIGDEFLKIFLLSF